MLGSLVPCTLQHYAVSQRASWTCMQTLGEPVQVFIDTEEEEGMLWAAATVDSIEAETGEFMVLVTEWDALDPEDDRFEEAYVEGPYTAAEEGVEWRRAQRPRSEKSLAGFVEWNVRKWNAAFQPPPALSAALAPDTMDTAALGLYSAINGALANLEAGTFTAEEQANTCSSTVTAAFAAACLETGNQDEFDAVYQSKAAPMDQASGIILMNAAEAAAAMFGALNAHVVAKFEAGDFASRDDAEAYGNRVTTAFGEACLEAGEGDFMHIFAAKLNF